MRWQRSWRSEAAARASRSARWPVLPSRATIFSATSRPLRSSRASQTWPIPPEPKGRNGRYRSRKRSCASADEDTLRGYGLARTFPLRAERTRYIRPAMDPRDADIEFDFFEEE